MTSRQPKRPDGPHSMRVLRPVAWAALLTATAAAAAGFGTPAFALPRADPPLPNTVPDSGSRPTPIGGIQLPGQAPVTSVPQAPLPSASGPLAARINSSAIEVAALGEQVLQLQQQRDQAENDLTLADANLRQMRDQLLAAQRNADSAAGDALKAAAALPPGAYDREMQDLDALQRLLTGQSAGPHPEIAGDEVERARQAEQNAAAYYAAMQTKHKALIDQVGALEKSRKTKEDALRTLRADNIEAVEAYERDQERREQSLGARYVSSESVAGMRANDKAMVAVRYALAQLGDPYVWAAEGPNSFDCSGLMWAAYRSAGYRQLPRVARDQYYYTRGQSVSQSALLPGDLIFFASGSSWQSVHHVGMYIGGGKMVHAPTTGDVVKVSTVWWSRFYAATRVFPAQGAPATPSAPPTTKPPKPPATTKPPKPGGGTKPPATPPTPPTEPTKPPTGEPTTPPPTEQPTATPNEPEEPTDPPAQEEPTDPPAEEEEPTTPPAAPATTNEATPTDSAATPTGTSGS
ncbi:NlpC/P60 family protein [Asanoa sp. WMMD1127]|uniref:C40 family peptidase n=1 Tax=Asanoa sp. WMMD1127 TaxID=3016107 RepID=UPI002415D1ED|nr:C40 family peptidase [Asanoa sp. WMMD1127]MDG4821647.1 NlpC/P60 family protein [Asanoa sp. WMMD1127]